MEELVGPNYVLFHASMYVFEEILWSLYARLLIQYATHVKKLLFWLRLAAYLRSDFSRNA